MYKFENPEMVIQNLYDWGHKVFREVDWTEGLLLNNHWAIYCMGHTSYWFKWHKEGVAHTYDIHLGFDEEFSKQSLLFIARTYQIYKHKQHLVFSPELSTSTKKVYIYNFPEYLEKYKEYFETIGLDTQI